MIEARQFTSAAEMQASAAAVRARLYGSNRIKTKHINSEPAPEKIVFRELRMWEMQPMVFDEHVVAYRIAVRLEQMHKSGEIERVDHERRSILQIVMAALVDFPGIEVRHLKGVSRVRTIVRARHVAMYEVKRQRPDMSYPAIGRWFGGRDHTTVLYAVSKIAAQRGEA